MLGLEEGALPPRFSNSGKRLELRVRGRLACPPWASPAPAKPSTSNSPAIQQADLGLRPDQKSAIGSAGQRLDASQARLNDTLGRTLDRERQPRLPPNLQIAQERSSKECEAFADSALRTLTPGQLARLEQIRLQNPLVIAMPDAELTAALGLTPDQITRARKILWIPSRT